MKANRMLSYSVIVSAALLATAVFATNNVACASNETASAVNGVTPDLTVAAEKAVNSVVYIKVTQNAKTQTYDYYDPFEDPTEQWNSPSTPVRSCSVQRVPSLPGLLMSNSSSIRRFSRLPPFTTDARCVRCSLTASSLTTEPIRISPTLPSRQIVR